MMETLSPHFLGSRNQTNAANYEDVLQKASLRLSCSRTRTRAFLLRYLCFDKAVLEKTLQKHPVANRTKPRVFRSNMVRPYLR